MERPGAALIVFSGELDKLIAAFNIATGAASMGLNVTMFFTFWGLAPLKQRKIFRGKSLVAKALTAFQPSGPDRLPLSRFGLLGIGSRLFRGRIRGKMTDLRTLMALARDMGVRMVVCQAAMDVMGVRKEELIEGVEYGGVASIVGAALDSRMTLFI